MSEPAAAPGKKRSGLGAMIAASASPSPAETDAPDTSKKKPTRAPANGRAPRPPRAQAAPASTTPPADQQQQPPPDEHKVDPPVPATPATAPAVREKISRGREGSRNRTIRLDDDEQRMVKELEFFLYRAGSLRGRIGPTFVHRMLLRLGHAMLNGREDELVDAAAAIEDPES